jgi:hypothetical protein
MNRYAAIPWPWAALFLCVALLAQEFLLRWFGAQPSLSQAVYRVSVMTLAFASLSLILLPPRRPAYLVGFLVCAALMAWAFWLQYGEGLEPCPLCMFQRVAVSAVGVVFLIAAIHNPRRTGAAFYAVLTLFQLVTLPVEFDASRRAKIILREMGIVQPGTETAGVNKVLNAAALTYIAAFVAALGNLLWLMSLRDRR